MKQHYYLFTNGKLKRKDNSIQFIAGEHTDVQTIDESLYPLGAETIIEAPEKKNEQNGEEKKFIPIETVESIFCFSETQFSRAVLSHLGKSSVPVFIYDYYGNYCGTFYPRSELLSGDRIVKQVKHNLDSVLRLCIAKEIITASIKNMDSTLAYYDNRGVQLVAERVQIQNMLEDAELATSIKRLMGAEGYSRKHYYQGWKKILAPRQFNGRSSNPPKDSINAILSFLYALLYNICVNECFRAGLHTSISYVHEAGDRRNSLALDVADIFKPIIVDRALFALLNTNVIDEKKHTRREGEGIYLNQDGLKIVTKKFDEKLKTTFHHRELNRSISYRQLVQQEFYKILSHLNGENKLKCFRAWW